MEENFESAEKVDVACVVTAAEITGRALNVKKSKYVETKS